MLCILATIDCICVTISTFESLLDLNYKSGRYSVILLVAFDMFSANYKTKVSEIDISKVK